MGIQCEGKITIKGDMQEALSSVIETAREHVEHRYLIPFILEEAARAYRDITKDIAQENRKQTTKGEE